MLADAEHGEPLAVMDSGSVTALRTGAATAVAAKFLARPDARVATLVGCGVQGEIQLAALAAVLPLAARLGPRHRSRRAPRRWPPASPHASASASRRARISAPRSARATCA